MSEPKSDAELRALAERAQIELDDPYKVDNIAHEYFAEVNPARIIALLDRADEWNAKFQDETKRHDKTTWELQQVVLEKAAIATKLERAEARTTHLEAELKKHESR